MFQLHDSTRRWVCVAGFLAIGVAPALLAAGWCLHRRMPGYVQVEARQMGRRLGVDVKLGDVRYLRPGVVLYEQLEAADPETGKTIFRCRLLEIACGQRSDPQGQSRPTLTMTASQPEVEAAALDRIWQCLQRTLEGIDGPLEADIQLSAAEVTMHAVHNSQTLADVKGSLEDVTGGLHAQIDFRLAGSDTPEPARIRMVRNRQVSPPASGFELYTGGGELPCNVLAMGLSELKPLGGRCRFRGYIWANETPDGWQGEVTGQLVDLDLGGLVSDYFPHKLTGSGEATIQSARFHRGRLEEGSAVVTAGPGAIDRSLVNAAIDRLGLAADAETMPKSELVPYEQLAFSATLDTQGLQLCGRCDNSGTILLGDGRRRLLGESRQTTPAVALVRTLVPQSAVQVPATRQTDWLLRHLPVPEATPVPGSEGLAPHARVRLPDSWQR